MEMLLKQKRTLIDPCHQSHDLLESYGLLGKWLVDRPKTSSPPKVAESTKSARVAKMTPDTKVL